MPDMREDAVARFATFVATLGRGQGRSRALSRQEAREAFGMVLDAEVDPLQVGAFLMLLRYRGEDPDEVTGLVEAARQQAGFGIDAQAGLGAVDLDWPSYGAGRTRGAPWFVISALALAQSGWRVLMHGSNEFSTGLSVPKALAMLGLAPGQCATEIGQGLQSQGFAYWPAERMAPALARLLNLRHLFGLRSPVNTVARLLDPADARASIDGVFHPPYIALHLGVAARLERRSLLVLKGGGGEAERSPAKTVTVHRWSRDDSRPRELVLPPLLKTVGRSEPVSQDEQAEDLLRVWRGQGGSREGEASAIGTIAVALLALDQDLDPEEADRRAVVIWHNRRREQHG